MACTTGEVFVDWGRVGANDVLADPMSSIGLP